MSSMFKKKGNLAFKPKIPSARPRPAAAPPSTAIDVPAVDIIEDGSAVVASIEAPLQDSLHDTPNLGESPRSSGEPTPKPISAPPAPTSRRQRRDLVPFADTPSTGPNASIVKPPPGDEASVAGSSLAHEEPGSEAPLKRPAHHRKAKGAVPLPAVQASLIAPELRDTPSIPESDEPAPPVPSTAIDESPTNASMETDSAPAQPAAQTVKPRATRAGTRRKTAGSAPGDADGAGDDDEAQGQPKKRQRKTPPDADGTSTSTSTSRPGATRRRTPNGTPKLRRARSVTPEDSEARVVDLQKLKMTDLTKDLHIGRKFSRHDELRDRERRSRLRSQPKDSASRDASEPNPPSTGDSADALPALKRTDSATPAATDGASSTTAGPQFRIVDGQIIVDQNSLVMDRHARANAARGDMETVEENDFTRLITSNSFMNTSKLRGPNIWTDDETELFYRGLGMFGTEFEMISRMFPNKRRRHVKLKYNREERHCPERITAALVGEKTTKMDLDEYRAVTGMEFESVESIEAQHRLIREGFEAEQQRVADEQAEAMRRKRDELFADDLKTEGGDGKKMKRGKKRGKQAVSYGLNGEPILTEP